jgi:predicted acetyltransferase
MKTGAVSERGAQTRRVSPAQIFEATEADHDEVGQVLVNTIRNIDRDRYYTSLIDPDYKPDHRLIARVSGRMAGHLLLTRRSISFDSVSLPAAGLVGLSTVPEFRGRGVAEQLIRYAARKADQTNTSLLALSAKATDPYENLGWVTVGDCHSVSVSSRNLPTEEKLQVEVARGGWNVRPWRQVELTDLMQIYDQLHTSRYVGSVIRSEAYWRWLVGMKMAHAVWVACQGDHVRGYAFVKDHHVLEIGADPQHPEAYDMLLCRIRAESLERAYPDVLLDVPPTHSVLSHLADWPNLARTSVSNPGNIQPGHLMMKVVNIDVFLNQIAPELHRRALAAKVSSGELGIAVGSNRWTLRWDEKSPMAVECGRSGRKTITLGEKAFLRLVMGQESIETLALAGLATFQHTSTASITEVLFPRRSIWRSTLDRYTY